jgi:hypothetical protein
VTSGAVESRKALALAASDTNDSEARRAIRVDPLTALKYE